MQKLNKRIETLEQQAGVDDKSLAEQQQQREDKVRQTVLDEMSVDELRLLRSAVIARDAGQELSDEQQQAFYTWHERMNAKMLELDGKQATRDKSG